MDKKIKKIMLAISDTGGGHRSAATAIIAALNQQYAVNCSISDILRTTELPGLKQAPEIYDYCSKKHLWLNNLFFRKTNSITRINALTKIVYFQARRSMERSLAEIEPDVVISVHPLVTGLLHLTRERSKASWPIITVVTDLVTIHASWATPGADLYLVPTQEAYYSMIKYGVPSDRIIYTGFPVHPKFIDNKLTPIEARKQLGIKIDQFTVLITGGGVGAGNMSEWVEALENKCSDKQILVITGNNKELYNALINRPQITNHMHIYGFVDNMQTLMQASDVIVSKAGPGTIMEGVTMRRPLIITEAVGIQETGNIDYLIKNKLGYYCPDPLPACNIINNLADKTINEDRIYDSNAVVTDGSKHIAALVMNTIDEFASISSNKTARQNGYFIGA